MDYKLRIMGTRAEVSQREILSSNGMTSYELLPRLKANKVTFCLLRLGPLRSQPWSKIFERTRKVARDSAHPREGL
ncbi:hypothetical protein XA68_11701 [Ophiocordyceps unilateralis]|uniref:Uncharacterized protein n=1 Tax=Ophiocordyceps unilateralis TaxID=268505 RepID=A0A2A9PG96_OPHUN|nr:hypothetical protein XA68_11701 [Ophiocordyceps unilateralis]